MKNLVFTFSLLFTLSFSLLAQDKINIDEQFNRILQESNTYQNYKVVKISEINGLQKNVSNSFDKLHNQIDDLTDKRAKLSEELNEVKALVSNLELELADTQDAVEKISMFGIGTNKSTYKTIVWTLISLLILTSSILFHRYFNSFKDIKELQANLSETESEFDDFRSRALEREQKLRRELLDEQNKNKN